jgi:hypothetical protein
MEQHGMLSQYTSKAVGPAQDLSHAVANSLRCAVQAHARRGPVPPAQWRLALRLVCEDARRTQVPIEHLLVALKQALVPLCDVFGVPYGPERTAFMSRLVTICIEEFYRAARP